MSIYRDIRKVTQIPYTEENVSFMRQREASTSQRNRRVRNPRPPRNVNLYDNDTDNNNDSDSETKYDTYQELHENEIASSIREVNCGVDYSNETLEENWKARQESSKNCSASSEDIFSIFKKSTIKINSETPTSEIKTDSNKNVEDEENILKRCKLDKNAAIRGLLRSQKISLTDLQVPNNLIDLEDGNTNIQNENISSPSNLTEGNYSIKLVQCPEDPDVFVQPLQAYGKIDESKHKDIDFSVPHIGKKCIVTPRQFFIQMDDSDFDFVKKDKKKEN